MKYLLKDCILYLMINLVLIVMLVNKSKFVKYNDTRNLSDNFILTDSENKLDSIYRLSE